MRDGFRCEAADRRNTRGISRSGNEADGPVPPLQRPSAKINGLLGVQEAGVPGEGHQGSPIGQIGLGDGPRPVALGGLHRDVEFFRDLPVAVAGLTLCYFWYRIIRSYRDLNSAKFKVIHEIEKRLPLRPYDAEWDAVGRGKDSKLYLPFTRVEIAIPCVFGLVYAYLVLRMIPWGRLWGILSRSPS